MRIAILALSRGGLVTARRIARIFEGAFLFCHPGLRKSMGNKICRASAPRTRGRGEQTRTAFFSPGLKAFTAQIFSSFDAIIFVMATGIAVRMIAPCLQHKKTDPAVITVDDTGTFAVSLLGGHQGGANDLAEQIAQEIGATAVITTATDRHRLLAFDLWARRRGWALENGKDMKEISKAQLAGSEILVYADLPSLPGRGDDEASLPSNCRFTDDPAELQAARHGVVLLSNHRELPLLPQGLPHIIIRPRNLVAGVGCRRGASPAAVIAALQDGLKRAGRVAEGLLALATIDLKGEEKGLQDAARYFKVPLLVFSREQVREIEDNFAASEFVRKHTGVGAVAEPCAFLGSGGGPLILEKRGYGGITVALAEARWDG